MAPTYRKKILCLANSRKISGRCIAGKEFDGSKFGPWIRPVSDREKGEISEEERRYEDGQDPKVLQIINVPMTKESPHGFQTENHLIDGEYYWTKEGEATSKDVRKALDSVKGSLWDNSSGSSKYGINDRVADATASKLSDSLKLVEVDDLTIEVAWENRGYPNAKRKVRGYFSVNGEEYKLAVTDPVMERQYLNGPDGSFEIGRAILCISLGESFGGFAWKLIATVIVE